LLLSKVDSLLSQIDEINADLEDKADKVDVVGFIGTLISEGAKTSDDTFIADKNMWVKGTNGTNSPTNRAEIVINGTAIKICGDNSNEAGWIPVKKGSSVTLKGYSTSAPYYALYNMV
jgi:hypothetical protein